MEAIQIDNNVEISSNKMGATLIKEQIDKYLDKNEYSRAFGLLLELLEPLDANEKYALLEHYQDKIHSSMNSKSGNVFPMDPYFNSR